MNKTIFGEPAGKYALGSPVNNGLEAALGPKFIGETPVVSLSVLNVPIPERQRLEIANVGGIVFGVLIGVALSKMVK